MENNKPKSNRGRKKGSTSFSELTLEELSKIFKPGEKIKVSRVQLDNLSKKEDEEFVPYDTSLDKLDEAF